MSTFYVIKNDNDLLHYGVLGMKWGVRRYQNKDGSLTAAGQKRYSETTKKDKRINSAKMATLGTLTTGPIGQLTGTIAGQVVSNKTADAIMQRQKRLLLAEAGAIGGFLLGNFINNKRLEITEGKEYIYDKLLTKQLGTDYAEDLRTRYLYDKVFPGMNWGNNSRLGTNITNKIFNDVTSPYRKRI